MLCSCKRNGACDVMRIVLMQQIRNVLYKRITALTSICIATHCTLLNHVTFQCGSLLCLSESHCTTYCLFPVLNLLSRELSLSYRTVFRSKTFSQIFLVVIESDFSITQLLLGLGDSPLKRLGRERQIFRSLKDPRQCPFVPMVGIRLRERKVKGFGCGRC